MIPRDHADYYGHGYGRGYNFKWNQTDCFWLMGATHCPWVEHRDGPRWASWCPLCGAGVANFDDNGLVEDR